MKEPNLDAQIRLAISDYLITGNLEAFMAKISERHNELNTLRRFF